MSEVMLNQIQGLLNKVSGDVERMGQIGIEQHEAALEIMDDLAAHMFATQAVLAVLVKKYPVELAEVEAWLSDAMEAGGDGQGKAAARAKYILGQL